MKSRLVWIAALPIALLAYSATTGTSTPLLDPVVVTASPTQSSEYARIRVHLETVERELLARDVSHLTREQQAARDGHIRVLREYRERGVFPHNHDFEGEQVPYFVDEHGTLCAMAYLISRSGREDLVEKIAASRNNARIAELAADAELIAWLGAAGISPAEAARIQPMYGCVNGCGEIDEPETVSAGYAVASTITSGVGGVSIGMNLLSLDSDRRSRWPGVMGIAAGALGVGLGLDRLGDGGAPAAVGAANVAIGAVAATLGARTLIRLPRDRAAAKKAVRPEPESRALSASPWFAADGGGAAGVRLVLRF
jgi:hypothetical protein